MNKSFAMYRNADRPDSTVFGLPLTPIRSQNRVTGLGLRFPACTLLCLALAFSFGCNKAEKEPEPEVLVQVAAVTRKPISFVVTSDAVITPIEQAAISPKITSTVKEFPVKWGDHVHKGELLAVLENEDLQASAVDTEGQYNQAQASYDTATAANLPEEMQKAQLDVDTGKQALDAQQKLFDSRQELFKQGALPRKDMDDATVSLGQARSQYQIAVRHLESMQKVNKEAEVKAAGGQLASAKGKYMGAQAALSYSEIHSPIDGIITQRPLYAGELAQAGTPFITVVNSSEVIARAHIPQSQAVFLKVGNPATIAVPGLEKPLAGKVTLVNAAADPNSTTIEVWVQAVNPGQEMKPGFTGTIAVVARTVNDALVIPAAALQPPTDGNYTVMIAGADNHAQQRKVQVGIRNGDEAQITDGIKEGEKVITNGAFGLPDKTAIKIGTGEKEDAGDATDKDKKSEGDKDKDKD